jgi:hypothetical protein
VECPAFLRRLAALRFFSLVGGQRLLSVPKSRTGLSARLSPLFRFLNMLTSLSQSGQPSREKLLAPRAAAVRLSKP